MMGALGWLAMAVVAGIFAYSIGPEIAEARCKDRWKPSGLNATYVLWSGCMVNADGLGRWVPEANVQITATRR